MIADSLRQLLNRNPKHRLGATRDAEELKEHAFFKSIDWLALSLRQIPPPFKPYVDSDESVANFDPEFTEANLLVEAPDDVTFDEDDPSADWLDKASGSSRPPAPARGISSGPVAIKQQRRPAVSPVAPLTNSVQENFRSSCIPSRCERFADRRTTAIGGFTFSGDGESLIHQAAGMFAQQNLDSPEPRRNETDDWEDADVTVDSSISRTRARSDVSMS